MTVSVVSSVQGMGHFITQANSLQSLDKIHVNIDNHD